MTDAPILVGLSGAVFLMSAETGGLIQSFEQAVARKKLMVYDATVGQTTGKVFHDPVATYTWRLIRTGSATTANTTASAAPGIAITAFANSVSGFGTPSGVIYTDTVRFTHNAEGLAELSGTAEQHAV